MFTHTVIAHWDTPSGSYVVYGDHSTAECCTVDFRAPALTKLQAWVKAQKACGASKKAMAQFLGMPHWAIASIIGKNCQIPTTTLIELADMVPTDD